MSHKLVEVPDEALRGKRLFGFRDDFYEYRSADMWTAVISDLGQVTITDAVGGIAKIEASDATVADNDETYLPTTTELFKFADEKPIVWEARMQYAEASTDKANIWVGLMDATIANALVDNGGGPKTSFSGFGFYKIDLGTQWNIIVSNGTSQKTKLLDATNSLDKVAKTAGGTAYQRFRATFIPVASDKGDFNFYIDGVHVWKQKDFDYSSAPTEMEMSFGVKNGAASAEVLNVDYAWAYAVR